MSDLKNPDSKLSVQINTATEIYVLKKPFLIQYCIQQKLKSTGSTKELRARLSKYLRGAITLEDVDDTLSEEEQNKILELSISNKIDLKKLQNDAALTDSSSESETPKKFDAVPNVLDESQKVCDSLNANLDSIENKIDSLLDTSNNLYYNDLKDNTDRFCNNTTIP